MLQPGAGVGADGFGFANENRAWIRIPQVGGVVLGDDVEVGANTTIDRGALEDTVIGNGVKLDNLVMVAHNVRIGEHTALAGCAGVAGSAVIGARCTVGGGARITGHVEIADEVHIAGNTGVSRSIDTPGGYSSVMPMMETREWRKNAVRIRQLDDLARRLKALERKLEQD
jgi:UDP-3-O-[3-hydroxymyristoyl] glucosamine N-acyltransferase